MFSSLHTDHILILLLQTVIVASLLLTLFRLRTIFGLALLFTALGVFQYIQVFLSSTIYIEVANNIYASPGNIVFTGGLFAILLIYIREDAIEARKVIYAILIANLVMSLMQIVISWGIDHEDVKNIYNLPIELFSQQSRVIIIGTLVLFIDVFVVIFLYETISKYVTSLFLRILFTMLLVLTLDTFLFSFGVFVGSDLYQGYLYAGFISKYSAAFIYTILFTVYLKYIDKPNLSIENRADTFKDIFYHLTYKQKFKQVSEEKIALFEKLQESKIQFQTFFENDVNINYIISPKGFLTSINPVFEKITGWSVSNFINKPFLQIVHPDDKYIAQASITNCLNEKEVKPIELRFLCKSGEYIYGEFTPILYKEKHKTLGVIGKVMDITERKYNENELRKTHDQLAKIVETVPGIVCSFRLRPDGSASFPFGSDRLSEYYGIPTARLIDDAKPFFSLIHQNDIDGLQESIAESAHLMSPFHYRFRLCHPILGELWIETRSMPVQELDGSVLWHGMTTDITQQLAAEDQIREIEKRHRLLFENTIDGMAYHQLIFENEKAVDYRYLQVNNAFETQTGLKEVVGKKASELIPNIHKTNPELLERFVQVVKTGKPMQYETYIEQSKTWYFTSLYALSDEIVVSVFKNITDAKLMEIELKNSEELLRLSSELANVAVWEYNFETDEMTRSKNHDSLYGLPTQEKWEFATFTNATHPDDREMCTLIIQNAIAVEGPDVYKFDFRVVYTDQSIHWLNIIGKVIKRNKDGQGILVRGFLIDITDRKIAENKLVESEKRYQTLFENMTSGFILFEVVQNDQGIPIDLIILAANHGFKTTTGLNLKENIGKRLTTVLPGIENDDADWIGTYGKIALAGESKQFEQVSEQLNVYFRVTAYQAEKNQCAVLFDDISERKLAEITLRQSEIHFRQLFENNPQIMWIYDLESLQFKDVNETAILKYGYSKEEFLSMTIKDIRPAEEVSLLIKNIKDSSEEFQKSKNWRHQLKDGTIIYVEIFSHILNFEQKPSRLVLVNDVTERHQAEEEINKYQNHLEELIQERTKELAKSEEALLNLVDDLNLKQTQLEISNQKLAEINAEMETFTYSVSHDLKAPLRGIDGYSNLLQEIYANKLNDEAKTFITNIRTGTQQMNQIIEDLLAYSRLDRTLFTNTNININQFAKHIIQLYQKELSDFKFEVDNQLPNTNIVADVDVLSIAFRNIFENAIKFTKLVENPKITILLEDKPESWHLIISDNGIGFDMKYYDKIFQIFQRLHRIEDYPGTGIGLTMVQKALHRMGGNVWASSELGKGTTFYMEIPKIKI